MSNLISSMLSNPLRAVVHARSDSTVMQCIDLMLQHNIGTLVVTDLHEQVLGVVSERDIVRGLLYHGAALLDSAVLSIVWADVVILKLTDAIDTAIAVITETKRHHVLVIDEGKLVAVLSTGDILRHLLDDKAHVSQKIDEYIQKQHGLPHI